MNESVISTFTGVKFIQGLTPMTQENWQSYFGSAIKNGVYSGLAPKNAPQSTVSIQVTDGVVFANGIQARLETEDGYTDIGSMLNTGLEDRLICVRVHYNSETAELIQKSNVTDIPSSAVERTKNSLFAQTLAKLTADESYLCTRNESYWDIPIFYQSKYNSWVMYGRDLRRKVELSPSKLTNPPLDTTDRTWQYGVLISGQNRYTAGESTRRIVFFPDVINQPDGSIVTISGGNGGYDFILSDTPYTGEWIYFDDHVGETIPFQQNWKTNYTFSNGTGVWTQITIMGEGTDNAVLGYKRTIPAGTSKSFRISFGGISVNDSTGYINPIFSVEEFDNIASVNWGRIGGSITAQTDLGDALALKANVTDVNDALALKANVTDVYTKTETDDALALKANDSDVYDKTEVDDKLALKADVSGVYTKTETDDALALKANDSDVYDKTEVDDKLALKANVSGVYTKTEIDNKLSEKANSSDVFTQSESNFRFAFKSDTYTKSEVRDLVNPNYDQGVSLYVHDTNGRDTNSGSNSNNPVQTLSRAIALAPYGKYTKIIAAGTFNENVTIPYGKCIGINTTIVEPYNKNVFILGTVTVEGGFLEIAVPANYDAPTVTISSTNGYGTIIVNKGGKFNVSVGARKIKLINTKSDGGSVIDLREGSLANFTSESEGELIGYQIARVYSGSALTYGRYLVFNSVSGDFDIIQGWVNGVYTA